MPPASAPNDRSGHGITLQMQRVADGFATLVREHLNLARLEAVADAKALGGDVAKVALFAPFLLIGYVFICVAVGVFVGQALGMGWGFLIVGGANLLVGGVGVGRALAQLKTRRVLPETVEEIRTSAALLSRKETRDVR